MNDLQYVRYEKKDHIAYLTINRPEVMNAVNPPTAREMGRCWQAFKQDDDAWVAILTGAGERAFSAGMDLRYRADADAAASREPGTGGQEPDAAASGSLPNPGFGSMTNPRSFHVWKPVIAAVNGYALGGGLEMALACDIIVAADTAAFGLPEVTRGIVAGAGGMHRLPRQVPLKIAMGYMLTGRHMPAAEAARWGLVNEVVPPGELVAAAERWAREIMECAPLSVRATKQAAMLGLDMSLEEAYNTTFEIQKQMQSSEDSREGPRAFAEKRRPVWQGR